MRYFTEKELRIEDAPERVRSNMKLLVEKVLDPLRAKVGAIRVNSGYRTPEHNKKVGGSPTSQHCKGEAADIFPLEKDIDDVFALIIREFKYDQVILEKNSRGSRWIHISYKEEGNRQKAMTASVINGKATYKNI
jgi:zinc D-Ala-D-Ala carboxypeptidase